MISNVVFLFFQEKKRKKQTKEFHTVESKRKTWAPQETPNKKRIRSKEAGAAAAAAAASTCTLPMDASYPGTVEYG
eukprot:scaffold77056_cov71-Attheya_sp.AAC.1